MTKPETKPDFKCPSCGVPLTVLIHTEAYKPTTINVTVKDVCEALPQDILPNLQVEQSKNPDFIHITPKKYLGKENFKKVSQAVKKMRGEWVSKGKESYWWVPTKQEVET